MYKFIILAAALLFLGGCASVNDSGNPINRSILLDSSLGLGLDKLPLPIPLPEFKIGFKLHYRRPTPREEIELNLSKLGKQLEEHNQVPKEKLRASPAPFAARENKD